MLNKAEAIKRLIAEAEDAANVLDAQYYYDHASDLREAIANFRAAMAQPREANLSAPPGASITPYQWYAGLAMQAIIGQYTDLSDDADISAACAASHRVAMAMVREPEGDEE